jgi:hypothetical protein
MAAQGAHDQRGIVLAYSELVSGSVHKSYPENNDRGEAIFVGATNKTNFIVPFQKLVVNHRFFTDAGYQI